jgi:hypothetical protein
MKRPLNTKQNFSSDKTKIILVSIALAILLLVFGLLMGILLRQSGFRLSMLATRSQATPNGPPTSIIPVTSNTQTVFVPTADCGSPTLLIGTTTFQIQNLTPTADGSLNVPQNSPGIAYWVEGTNTNYVFVLPPMPENLAAMEPSRSEAPSPRPGRTAIPLSIIYRLHSKVL